MKKVAKVEKKRKLAGAERCSGSEIDVKSSGSHTLCVAPMMAYTDRHCRYLHRLLAPKARLYTEMVTTDTLLHGDAARRLRFHEAEHPLALQVGGGDPHDLARTVAMAAAAGFDEVNLNVGCPSERVRSGGIGACLMREPHRVADCVAAMRDAASLPVTVKCRLGVAETAQEAAAPADDYAPLRDFVGCVAAAGAHVFIVHARKAVLRGLTPAQNRNVPPLRPPLVERLKREFPHLAIIYNGGVRDTAAARDHLRWADGVMIGRAAYRNPVWLSRLAAELLGGQARDADEAFAAYLPYVAAQLAAGERLHAMSRHLHGLFNGRRGARRYRQLLAERDHVADAGLEVLSAARALVAKPRPGDLLSLPGRPATVC